MNLPRTGRPKAEKTKSVSFNIRLEPETDEKLKAFCEKHGMRRSEAIRLAIERLVKE